MSGSDESLTKVHIDLPTTGREMNLTDALSAIVDMDAGALVSCIPGKLAYFEMKGLGERYLLMR